MDTQYNPKSCNVLEKSFYTPLEAVIRWCGLFEQEEYILSIMGDDWLPKVNQFPQWPCLRNNVGKIQDAIRNGDLDHGRDGITVSDHVAPSRLTVRHSDIKEWMAKYFPDQKPAFLFDEIERSTHSAINAETFMIVQADRDALKARLDIGDSKYQVLQKENSLLQKKVNNLTSKLESAGRIPGVRSESSYQKLVAVLLKCIVGEIPGFKKSPSFESEAKLIEIISDNYGEHEGLSQSTLTHKIPKCKRSL